MVDSAWLVIKMHLRNAGSNPAIGSSKEVAPQRNVFRPWVEFDIAYFKLFTQTCFLIVSVGDNGNGNNPLFFEIIEIIYRGIEKWPISLVS